VTQATDITEPIRAKAGNLQVFAGKLLSPSEVASLYAQFERSGLDNIARENVKRIARNLIERVGTKPDGSKRPLCQGYAMFVVAVHDHLWMDSREPEEPIEATAALICMGKIRVSDILLEEG